MFFRGAQFQRDGHARCNLLLSHTLLSNSADLSPVGLRALTGRIPYSLCARVAAHNRKRQKLHSCSDRYLFDTTQSIFLGIGPVMRLCHRLQLAPSRSPHFEWPLVEALVADQPPTPHASRSGTPHGRSDRHPVGKARTQRTRALRASE